MNSKELCILFCFSDFDVMVIEPQLVAEESDNFLLILTVQQLKDIQLLYFNILNLEVPLKLLNDRLLSV